MNFSICFVFIFFYAFTSKTWHVCFTFVGQLVSEARKGKKRDCPEVIYMWRVTH